MVTSKVMVKGKAVWLNKRLVKISLIVLAALLLAVGSYDYYNMHFTDDRYDKAGIGYQELIKARSLPLPKTSVDTANYYTAFGNSYFRLGDYKAARQAYETADANITNRSPETGQSIDLALAKVCQKLGDLAAAKKYLRREAASMRQSPLNSQNLGYADNLEKAANKL